MFREALLSKELEFPESGTVCEVIYSFIADYISNELTKSCLLEKGEIILILDISRIPVLDSIEVTFLLKGTKMWFNIKRNNSNMLDVRRAESYEIPFMAINENESGSKLSL